PGFTLRSPFPFTTWPHTPTFVGNIHPGRLAQPEMATELAHAVNSHTRSQVVKINIARLCHCLLEFDRVTVTAPLPVAPHPTCVRQPINAGIPDGVFRIDDTMVQPRKRNDGFDGRAGRINPLYKTVVERTINGFIEITEILMTNAGNKEI